MLTSYRLALYIWVCQKFIDSEVR